MLRLFVCTDHDGIWPVGVASVILATDEEQARILLDSELLASHLKPHDQEPYTLWEIPLDRPMARILRNGDY